MRIVLISQIPAAAHGLDGLLRALGHEPVALLVARETDERYGNDLGGHIVGAPEPLDVLMPASRERIGPLLGFHQPDLAVCAGFPWKIPPDALAVPRHGIVNLHPSFLPRYRGPVPVGWAIRNGDSEIGVTVHRMDAELDTGAILAQSRIVLGDEFSFPELQPKMVAAVGEVLATALARIERGELGEPQQPGGEYGPFFEPEYVWIDWSRPVEDVFRQVRSWRFSSSGGSEQGALTELDGQRVRVLRVSREPGAGRRMECGDGPLWILETEPA
jgi:methionyl-tRNA formyltransferase